MKIVLGADPWGLNLKNAVKRHLQSKGLEVSDLGGTPEQERPYYEVAAEVARTIRSGAADRGILFCGTGMGVAIVANKFKGIRAAVVESELAAAKCRIINDANVLALGGMFVSEFVALLAVDHFLELAHTEGTEPELAAFLRRADAEIQKLEAENFR